MLSFPSKASNLTQVALERIERLEKSLEAERAKRENAEKERNALKVEVHEKLS